MSDGLLTPGERPGPWQTLGDHQRRIRALEAVNVVSSVVDLPSFSDLILAQTADLFAYWPMTESSGDLIDLGPHGIDMSVASGSPVYGVTGPFPPETAVNLNGGWFEVQVSGALADMIFGGGATHAYTVVAIAKMPVTADANDGVFMAYLADQILLYFTSVGGPNALRSLRYTDDANAGTQVIGSYLLAIARYDSTNLEVFVNGDLVASTPANDNIGSAPTPTYLRIGAVGQPGTLGTQAHISNVALFTDAISDSLIAQLSEVFITGGQPIQEGTVPVADGEGSYEWLFPIEVEF